MNGRDETSRIEEEKDNPPKKPRRARGSAVVMNRGTKDRPKWYVRFTDADGRRKHRLTHQPTKETATQWLAAINTRIANGKVGIEERTEEKKAQASITVRQLAEKFLGCYSPPKLKDVEEYRAQTRSVMSARVYPTLGNRTAASLKSADIERLPDALLAETYAPGSVSWTMARLSKVYTWGNKEGYIACANPVSGVDHPVCHRTLDFLTKEEVGGLLSLVERSAIEQKAPGLYPMIATAIFTGLRKGELFGLRWADVVLDACRLDVSRSYTKLPKSGKPRHLPLHPALLPILRAWKKRCPTTKDGLVFPQLDVCDGFAMGKRRNMLGLPYWLEAAGCHVPVKPWHALRHTFASHFMMAGGNILTLQKLLGHASLDMTLIYAHLAPDFMAGEIARMTFPLGKADVASLDEERRRRALLEGTERAEGPA